MGKKTAVTKVIDETLNPTWNEKHSLQIRGDRLEIMVLDQDKVCPVFFIFFGGGLVVRIDDAALCVVAITFWVRSLSLPPLLSRCLSL